MEGVPALLFSLLAVLSISAGPSAASSCTRSSRDSAWNTAPPGMKWEAASGGTIPSGGVAGGVGTDGKPVYVCRGNLNGNLITGKASKRMGHCDVAWGGKEHLISSYEVLVNVDNIVTIEWEDASDGSVPSNAVAGGYTCGYNCNGVTGDYDYVGRTNERVCPGNCLASSVIFSGKIIPCRKAFYYSYGGKGYKTTSYQAMVWKYKPGKCDVCASTAAWNHLPSGLEWVSASGGYIPSGAVAGGVGGNGKPVYVCRAKYDGLLIPGKASKSMRHCDIPWGGKEHDIYSYEVLVKSGSVNLEWVDATDGAVPSNTVAAGYTCACNGTTGEISYIARSTGRLCLSRTRCLSSSLVFPGKLAGCYSHFYWSYGGKEYHSENYQALVYSN